MPSLADYIPPKQADMAAWLANFSALISANPSPYGLASADAATIAALNATWQAAYLPVTSPSTRTPQAVSAKDAATATVLPQIRTYAQNVSANPGVSVDKKMALGVNPRTSTPSPITPPTTYPILNVQAGANFQLYVRYRDSAASVSVKAKPYGVQSCQIFYKVSDSTITDPTQLATQVTATKSPALVSFPPSAGGMQAYLAGYWLCRNGKQGGFGPIVNFTVPIGG